MILAATLCACGPPPPVPAEEGEFSFSLPRTAWVYLTPEMRGVIDRVLGDGSRDLLVILHSTGTSGGSVAALDDYHRRVKGDAGGMPYHVLIGNGHGLPNGKVHFSQRFLGLEGGGEETGAGELTLHLGWVDPGGEAPPGRAQLAALDEVLDYFAAKTPHLRVRLHREVEHSTRACPGEGFPVRALREAFSE